MHLTHRPASWADSPGPEGPGEGLQAPRAPLSQSSQSALQILEYSTKESPVSVVVFGPDGVCGWANPATAALLGVRDCGDLVGRLDLLRHCSAPGDATATALGRALRGEERERLILCYHLGGPGGLPSADGAVRGGARTVVVSAQPMPLMDEYGGVAALCVFNFSQTEVSQTGPAPNDAEDARLHNSIATARLLSRRLAHDFNNVIAVVQGYADLLQSRLTQDQESRSMAEQIKKMGEEAAVVTNRLAQFASPRPLDITEVDLNQLVQAFLASDQAVPPAGVQVQVETGEAMPPISADRARLEQLCRNLWQNAVEAMPQGGRVIWRTDLVRRHGPAAARPDQPESPCLLLRVVDTGVGMDEPTRQHMFDPFFTTKHGRARGLGLTEVYETVTAHRGCLEVSSCPDGGTCIDLYFPVQQLVQEMQASPLPEKAAVPIQAVATSRRRRWLVADDSPLIRLLLQQLLGQDGNEVIAVGSGKEALDIYQRRSADIDGVILDLALGDMSGAQLFQSLREINSQVKVIVISGDTRQPAVGELRARGVCGVLAKPFRREELADVVSRAAAA